jgi:hypothetical protein
VICRNLLFSNSDEGKGEENTPSHVLFNGVREAIEKTMIKPLVFNFVLSLWVYCKKSSLQVYDST